MRTDTAHPVRLADYRPSDFLIDRVELDIALHATETAVRAQLSLRSNPAGRPGAALELNGDGLVLHQLALDDALIEAPDATPDRLRIAEPPARPFVLTIETRLDPTANTQLMGLYRSGSAYCTQCEAEGFRRITYFLDRPDVLTVWTTRIEADVAEAPVLLGNGNRVAAGECGTGRHFAIWHDPFPKPSYLFALVGGTLGSRHDTFTTRSGREVALGIYVEYGNEDRAAFAMEALKRSMAWDETAFGREYDLDVFNIVAVSDFNMGAMENKGLNIFNDKYILASSDTATDADYFNIDRIIAHEYFHNWTGNRITCRDWFQLCLKEGLTVFRDQEYSGDQRSRAFQRIADVRNLRAAQFPEDAGPLAHNVRPETYMEINNFYTATVYEKGAEVIRMLRELIGADAFRRGMDLYFERHDGTAATIEEFLRCFAETSHRDLDHFARWYHQAGTPVLHVTTAYDAAARRFTLDLAQQTPPTPGQVVKEPFVIPIALGLVAADGAAIPLVVAADDERAAQEAERGLFELSSAARRIVFENVPEPPVASVLRGFSAPVRLVIDHTEADLLRLVKHDSDTFNRWQAGQTLGLRLIRRRMADEGDPRSVEALADAIGAALVNPALDPGARALILTLPSETDLTLDIGSDIDPTAIHAAQQGLKADLGRLLQPQLRDILSPAAPKPYRPEAADISLRLLRNTALHWLAIADPAEGERLSVAQFEAADNMTDRYAALDTLSWIPGEAREQALTTFFERYRDDALVLDKWLSLQARIPEPTTLDRVKRLMAHPAFTFTNPNRLRALVGAFAGGNATQFHAPDGSGYDFVIGIVAAIDARNPQVAARLLTSFRTWRTLEPGRRALAEAALRKLSQANTLSVDVRDIVMRSLT